MFDEKKPYGQILGLGVPGKYVQGGKIYDSKHNEIGDDPNAVAEEDVQAAQQLMVAEEKAEEAAEAAEVLAAEKRLGELGDPPEFVDPSVEANRENAAALQAETASE